jgi:uncharacterized protein
MKIQVGGVSEGVHAFHFDARASDLSLGEEFSTDLRVDVTVEKTGNEILLKASIHVVGTFECDRCVTQFVTPLSPKYQMYYVMDQADAERFDPADVQVMTPGLTVIDMSDDVRQIVLLSVPLKRLCRPGCRGLCPQCGKNLNEGPCGCTVEVLDSRWDTLRSLKDRIS